MKKRLGIDITGSWTFTPGAAGVGTIAFSGITLSLDQILQVVNATRNTTIYNFGIVELGEAAYSNNVLTLTASTTGMSASDRLMVWVDVDDYMTTQEESGALSLLARILAMLMSPMGFDRSLQRQRSTTVIESGTVTTVSTVSNITAGTITNVTGMTNIDGRNGAMLVNQTNLSAWANAHRARIT